MKSSFVVEKRSDGRVWLSGGSAPIRGGPALDYTRELSQDEVVDGVPVRDLPVGFTNVKHPEALLEI